MRNNAWRKRRQTSNVYSPEIVEEKFVFLPSLEKIECQNGKWYWFEWELSPCTQRRNNNNIMKYLLWFNSINERTNEHLTVMVVIKHIQRSFVSLLHSNVCVHFLITLRSSSESKINIERICTAYNHRHTYIRSTYSECSLEKKRETNHGKPSSRSCPL